MPKRKEHRSAPSWTYVMVRDGPGIIDEQVRIALEMAVYKMYLDKWEATRFKVASCDGYVENSGQTHSIATRIGVLFKAQIEAEAGMYRINFLVNERDLEAGATRLKNMERGDPGYGIGPVDERLIPEAMYQFLQEAPRQLQ